MNPKELALKLHRWLGIATAALAIVLCATGAVLLIAIPAESGFEAPARPVSPADIAPASALLDAATAAVPDHRPNSIAVWHTAPVRAQVQFQGGTSAWLDAGSAEVLEVRSEGETTAGWWIDLHTTLFLGGAGRTLVGLGTIAFALMTALGVWLWWPTRRTLRRALVPSFRRGFRRANYDLHNVLGFYSALLLFVLSGTGILLAYPGLQRAAFSAASRLLPAPSPSSVVEGSATPADSADAAEAPLDLAWSSTREIYPDAPWQRAFLTGDPVRFRVQAGAGEPDDMWRFHTLRFDPQGRLRRVIEADDTPLTSRLPSMVGRLHTGDYGLPYRIGSLLACLVGATLPITGLLIWYPRWRKKRQP